MPLRELAPGGTRARDRRRSPRLWCRAQDQGAPSGSGRVRGVARTWDREARPPSRLRLGIIAETKPDDVVVKITRLCDVYHRLLQGRDGRKRFFFSREIPAREELFNVCASPLLHQPECPSGPRPGRFVGQLSYEILSDRARSNSVMEPPATPSRSRSAYDIGRLVNRLASNAGRRARRVRALRVSPLPSSWLMLGA